MRWTNRLHRYLESHGQAFWFCESWLDRAGRTTYSYTDTHIVEAELSPQSRGDLTDYYDLLGMLQPFDEDFGLEYPAIRPQQRSAPLMLENPDWRDNVVVLWLSETVFVIRHTLDWRDGALKDTLQLLYSIELYDYNFVLSVHRIIVEQPADPETFLGFVAPFIPPIMSNSTAAVVVFGAAPDVDAALSLVPTTAHDVARGCEMFLVNCSPCVLQALAAHPVHPNILLGVVMEPVAPERHSLSLGIELGTSAIPHFGRVAGTHGPTLQWRSRSDDDRGDHDSNRSQTEFDALCQNLTLSVYAQGFSGFQVSFPSSMRSNLQWDAHVSPVLVLNSLLHKQGGVPPAPYAELAIQRINQGDLYRRVTNLVPFDLCAANTSAIFSIVRAGADFFSNNEPSLDEIDEFCIENVAEVCMRANAIVTLGGESNLDERDALVNQLENQRSALLARVELIDYYLQRLVGGEAVGEKSEDAVSNEQHYIPG
jgi:hypothetical protein